MLKRTVDILVSTLALIFAMPLLASIGLIVLVLDGSPVVFRQKRVGRSGVDFTLYKFRTMRCRPQSQRGDFDAGDASRVTSVGAFLRHWKLDELPQLWNVLRGDMSLVGPRPEIRKWVDAYPAQWASIHKVRPGITDPASIVYRHEEAILSESDDPEKLYAEKILPSKLAIYSEYVSDGHSVGKDALIMFRTVAAVVAPLKEAA